MGVRNVVMGLIEHDNEELRRQALQCVSKMLVQNWEVCANGISYGVQCSRARADPLFVLQAALSSR